MNGAADRASSFSAPVPSPIEPGLMIKDRWRVCKSIGKGAFGEIFSADDLEMGCAVGIKVERIDSKKRVLKIEVAVLKKLQPCPFVCRYHQFGRHDDFYFVVMQLLGENLSVLRKRQPGKRFTIGTTCRLGVQMVRAIEGMHDFGYLHRDIKPSNFAMGLDGDARDWCFMIDFGLARRFTLPNGDIRTARDSAGFRGTARYASINSHLSKELARRDDMWSMFYLIIEFMKGSLPWSNIENKEDVGRRKIELDTPSLVEGLPAEMGFFMDHLRMLEYRHRPDYDYINSLFNQMMENHGVPDDEAYDWDKPNQANPSGADHSHNESRIPKPSTAAVGSAYPTSRETEARRPRDSPHQREDSPKPDMARSSSAARDKREGKPKSKRISSRNNSTRRGAKEHETAQGLGIERDSGRRGRSGRRTKRMDEAPVDVQGLAVHGLEQQGGADNTRRTLMRGKLRNSPMSNTSPAGAYDSEAQMAQDLVTDNNGSPEPPHSNNKTSHAASNGYPQEADAAARKAEEEAKKPETKEPDEKGGSCRCVIA